MQRIVHAWSLSRFPAEHPNLSANGGKANDGDGGQGCFGDHSQTQKYHEPPAVCLHLHVMGCEDDPVLHRKQAHTMRN